MDYVCKVVGELSIEEKDLNLRMSFNEIIDLSPDDFKVSPRLRAALRNKEIEVYTPTLHKKARRLKSRKNMKLLKENIIPLSKPTQAMTSDIASSKELNEIKSILGTISNKMNNIVSRMDYLVNKIVESNNALNVNLVNMLNKDSKVEVNYNNEKLDYLLNAVVSTQNEFNNYIKQQDNSPTPQNNSDTTSIKEDKLNDLLDSINKLLKDGIKIDGKNLNIQNSINQNYSKVKREDADEDIPRFVPKIETDLSNKNILTKEIASEGTGSILDKLKNLK